MTTATMYVTWAKNVATDPQRRDQAITDLKTYFAKSDGVPNYTGSRFESLGGGGDRPEVANVVTAEDLLALSLLSVPVNGEAALYLLEGKSHEISNLLAELPTDTDLADLAPEDLGSDWPARELWRVVRGASDFRPGAHVQAPGAEAPSPHPHHRPGHRDRPRIRRQPVAFAQRGTQHPGRRRHDDPPATPHRAA